MDFIHNNNPSGQKSNYTKIKKKKEHMKQITRQYTNLLEQQCQRTQLLAQCTDQKPRLYNTKHGCK